MNDPDQTITWFRGDGLQEPPVGRRELRQTRSVPRPILPGGLVNLGFFTAALRRSAWVWCLTAVVGLVIGSGLYLKFPPAYHATTTVLLVDNATQDPAVEVQTEHEPGAKSGGGSTCGAATEAAAVCRQLPGRLHGHDRH